MNIVNLAVWVVEYIEYYILDPNTMSKVWWSCEYNICVKIM